MEPSEKDPNSAPGNPAPPRSAATEVAIGGALGGTIGLITSLFNKKTGRGKQVLLGALAGAGLALAQHMLSSNRQTPPEPPITPPAPPALPPIPSGQPHEFALGNIPLILDLLVSRNALTPEQKATILTGIAEGRTGFAGELVIADGFITRQQLDEALHEQAARKAAAAVTDINMLAHFGTGGQLDTLALPRGLKANWGNNGVNPAPAAPTLADGASAAANNAQNLVMLAYHEPKDSPLMPTLIEGVSAAANLTRGILNGDSALVPLSKMQESWKDSMNKALRAAAAAHPDKVTDSKGTPIAIDTFIAARDAEISAAVAQSLANGNNRAPEQGRA